MNIPMRSIYSADDGDYFVPPEWEQKYALAKEADYRAGSSLFGVFSPSWANRRAVEVELGEEIRAGRICKIDA